MDFRHDPEADAVYVGVSDKPYAYGIDIDDMRRIDYAADDTAVGVELLGVSGGVNVDSLPSAEEIEEALEAIGIDTYTMQMSKVGYSGVVFDVSLAHAEVHGAVGATLELTDRQEVTA